MATNFRKKKANTNLLDKRKSKDRWQTLSHLEDNPDPFAPNASTPRKNHNHRSNPSSKSSKKNKKRKSTKYSSSYPTKKRKVSEIQSITSHSHSSSDIEILNLKPHSHHRNGHHRNNHTRPKHNRNGVHKRRKSPSKPHRPFKYNLYANALLPAHNGHHSSISSDHSNKSVNGNKAIIPFPKEKNRSKLHSHDSHDSLDTRSQRSHRSFHPSISTRRNQSFDETVDNYSQISRRSKSRSPSPPKSQSPRSQLSSKLTEPQDQLVLSSLRIKPKPQIPFREAAQDAVQPLKRNKPNPQKSSLWALPLSSNNTHTNSTNHNGNRRTYSRPNSGGKHRTKSHKHLQKLFVSMRTSHLNDLPNPEILTTDLDKKGYQSLMRISTEEKKKKISEIGKYWSSDLVEFVEETDQMAKVHIDLTMENDEENESNDVVILNTDEDDDDDDDDMIILNESPFSLRKAREHSHKKFDAQIKDDLYRSQRFGQQLDPKQMRTERICAYIQRYKQKKEEQRKRKEEEERLRKEAKRKELEALQAAQAAEAALAMESVSNCRDLKLRDLDEEDEELIEEVFQLPSNQVVGTHKGSNIEVRVKDLQTLEEGQWLNDEVMNFYMALLQDRNLKRIQDNPKHVRVLFMNTFFFTKLSSNSYNYKAVKRWTKKAKLKKKGLCTTETIFELDKFIFPVHVNRIHWCCGCINFKQKKFEYFDSMNGSAVEFFRIIRRYIEDEFKDKLKSDATKYNLNLSEWTDDNHRNNYPQQQNGVDCGVFTSKCADWISDELRPDYSQEDMQYFRDRIMVEIIRGRTLDF